MLLLLPLVLPLLLLVPWKSWLVQWESIIVVYPIYQYTYSTMVLLYCSSSSSSSTTTTTTTTTSTTTTTTTTATTATNY